MLIKSTATSVSVTLDILAMSAMLRSTNASLRPVFTVGSSIFAVFVVVLFCYLFPWHGQGDKI